MDEMARRVLELEAEIAKLQSRFSTADADQEVRARKLEYLLSTLGTENFRDSITTDLKFYKNLCYNSSFERPGAGQIPEYWTGGTVSTEASWYGSSSLRLTPGQVAEQQPAAYADPGWYERKRTWVALMRKFGALRVEVVTDTGVVLAKKEFAYAADWPKGKVRFTFEPGTVTKFYLRLTNIDSTYDAYVDAVQVEPDWTGKWPSLYSDGPFSAEGGGGGGSFFRLAGAAVTSVGEMITLSSAVTMPAIPVIAVADAGLTAVTDLTRAVGGGTMTGWNPPYFAGRVQVSVSIDGAVPSERRLYQAFVGADYSPAMPLDGAVGLLFDGDSLQLNGHLSGTVEAGIAPDFPNVLRTQAAPWDQMPYFASLTSGISGAISMASVSTGAQTTLFMAVLPPVTASSAIVAEGYNKPAAAGPQSSASIIKLTDPVLVGASNQVSAGSYSTITMTSGGAARPIDIELVLVAGTESLSGAEYASVVMTSNGAAIVA